VRTIGTSSNRDGIGSRVTVTLDSGRKLWGVVKTGSSYCSQSELPLTFGLGRSSTVAAIEITWPSGRSETIRDVGANQVVTLEEGKGLVRNVPTGSR
jgi:enediyne biosynthesis protein E4